MSRFNVVLAFEILLELRSQEFWQLLTTTHFYGLETMERLLLILTNEGGRVNDKRNGKWPHRDPLEEIGTVNLYNFCANAPIASTDGDGRLYYKEPSNELNLPGHCGAYDFFFPLYLSNFTPKQGVVVQYVHIMRDWETCGIIGRLFLHRHEEWTFWEYLGGVMQGTQANTQLRYGDESAEGDLGVTEGYERVVNGSVPSNVVLSLCAGACRHAGCGTKASRHAGNSNCAI